MLHLAFRDYTDLETESSGEGLRRFRRRLSSKVRRRLTTATADLKSPRRARPAQGAVSFPAT